MEWSERFATGIQRIDDQHRMLFRMTSDFRSALDEGRGEPVYEVLLQSLDVYARGHFAFEENCMEQYRCPIAHLNQKAHSRFIEIVADHHLRFKTGGFKRSDARNLVDTLDEWLANHIGRIDTQLRPYVSDPSSAT